MCLSIISGLSFNFLVEDSISLIYRPPQFKPGTHLTLEQAYNLYRQGRALFVDTRYKGEFEHSHIKGAVNLPFRSSMDEIIEFLTDLSKEQIIVTYCNNPSCNTSRRLAGFLLNRDFKNVFIYLAGFDAWKDNNLPVEMQD
jgi:rhodanese-related sulfurtransferase